VRIIATSNDPVRLSFLTALLADAGIAAFVLDAHTSAVEGSAEITEIASFPLNISR